MNTGEILTKLKYALQALAQPAAIQASLFRAGVQVADDLALDFVAWYSLVVQKKLELTASQKGLLHELDRSLYEMGESTGKDSLWTQEALEERAEWEHVRLLARQVLDAFGWALAVPPLDRNQSVRSPHQK